MDLKTAVEGRKEFFTLTEWVENGLGFLTFWVKSFDRANREIGGLGSRFFPKTGSRFLPQRKAFHGGRASSPARKKTEIQAFNCGFQDEPFLRFFVSAYICVICGFLLFARFVR